jgi:lipoate-protein ligase B
MEPAAKLTVVDLGVVDYAAALDLQTAMVAARIEGRVNDTLLLMEHPHVITLGRGADERFIVANPKGVPTYRVSRGGQVTYHGPGQLIGYPILKLEGRARDVTRYLRNLEQAMIDALREFGLDADRRAGLTGIWIGARKIASIGVGIRRWVTYHGFALNVSTDLSFFDAIVPCGIEGCRMTSISESIKLGRGPVTVREFGVSMRSHFARVFGYDTIVQGPDPFRRNLTQVSDFPSGIGTAAGKIKMRPDGLLEV